jgi:putative transposase
MYFVTLCVQDFECIFGQVIDNEMHLNELGHIVREEWLRSPAIRSELDLDRWIVMPNHLHGIVIFSPCPSSPLPLAGARHAPVQHP